MTATAEAPDTAARSEPEPRPGSGQLFWTVVVAVPAALSLLRLWIEAGGQLQTTLMIVSNVNPGNLFAAVLLIGTRTVTMALLAVLALGGLLALSATAAEQAGRPFRRRPLFARCADATELWLLVAIAALAAMTWPILYLPLLLPALVMAGQATAPYRGLQPWERRATLAALLAAYAAVTWPTVTEAWRQAEPVVVLLLVVPPLLTPLVSGPVPRPVVRVLAGAAQPAVLLLGAWALLPLMAVPVLPLTATTVREGTAPPVTVLGYVIDSDDELTAILQEHGGLRYVHNDEITARVLCPSPDELPVYRIRVHQLHVEDSLLEAWGRQRRPVSVTDAVCRGGRSPDRTSL
ncbi:hypothetical protein [Jidongwangia harbinensis]|uniref:hypothetical protein n=1 Tax=Jidongwangia harbinensis TaxID=2878561 RepID=UPI001CDA2D2E|nr:hypothetical protein [Jidongwangia harbinensis]MCA2217371.1 hypothetical protein [Jidongwangia harbinensis]